MAATKFGNWIEIKKLTTDTGQATTHLVYKDGDETRLPRVLKHMKDKGPFPNRLARFRSEIEACNRLSHPNIIRLIESGLHKEKPFIVTEYCEGGSLSPKILVGMTLVERLNLFRGICEGIAYAHSQGVVHRDLKPDNIFLHANGNPVVGDFGLCFFLDGAQDRATHADEAVGARWYMAPECESGRSLTVGTTADVYSLGKVLYWMLAGRIFSREQHSRAPYDLRPNQPTTDMSVVYKLFERTILEDLAARLKDGVEVVRELDAVLHRILSRRRVFDLANSPLCAANHTEVRVVSFRPGSTVTYDLLDTAAFQVKGFGSSGDNLALWGVRPPGRHPTELAIFTSDGAGSWRSSHLTANGGFSLIQSGGYESLAFDSRGQACVAVTEVQNAGQDRKVLLAKASGGSELTTVFVADGVGSPRHSALAFGPSGEIAIYSGYDQPAKSGANSETIVKADAALDRHPTHPLSNFSAPLAFDRKGKLHQAVVATVSGGTQEVRSLFYISKEPGGVWAQATVDSTAGHGALGPSLGGRMSGHISLCLTPAGSPVILTNSSRLSAEHLTVYFIESGAWENYEIDLRPVAAYFGISSVETGGWKQLLFDTYLEDKKAMPRAHISIFTDQGGTSGILYLTLDEQWNVMDKRFLPALEVFGMSIDQYETAHLALR